MSIEEISEQKQDYGIVEKQKTSENENENLSQEEFFRKSDESQVSYLKRAKNLIAQAIFNTLETKMEKMTFVPSRAYLSEDIKSIIESVMSEALKSQESVVDLLKNDKEIKDIESVIGYHDKGDLTDSASFDKTQRNRNFFDIQRGKGSVKYETYWNTLFFPYNTEATREFAKKTLDDKVIVLLGGGRSHLKDDLQKHNIVPNKIVNVDPFVENIESKADPVISLSASDENFIEKMHKEGVESADEILAEYSVPAYLKEPKEIEQLFKNIDALLAEDGSARIWPIQVSGRGEDDDKFAKKNALIESLKSINQTKKYEIVLYQAMGRNGLILHKLAPSKKELQKEDNQKKIEEIRNKIELN